MKKIIKNRWCPRVALLIETVRGYARELLMGISKYRRTHGSWSIEFEEGDPGVRFPEWFKRGKWDGVIAQVKTPEIAQQLRQCHVPVVDVHGTISDSGFPSLRADDIAVGRMGAEHLLEHGFRRFGFCGFNGMDWSDKRRTGFIQRISEAGYSCQTLDNPPPRAFDRSGYEEHEEAHVEELKRWLQTLPRRLGLMACNDSRGRQLLNCCQELNLKVPDELAVIGVDRDEVLCELSDLPLSSIILNAQLTGYEAAALLDRLITGGTVDRLPILIKPIGVAQRHSTDVLAIEDSNIAAALSFIREHACGGLDVPGLLKVVSLSRSVLERRFIKILGRSPKEEILRVRLERVCRLLEESDMPLKKVAESSGFDHIEYLSRFFKKKKGMTPGEFRKQFGSPALKR